MNYEEFIEHLEKNPFKGNQEQCGTGKDYWNADFWTLEVARCLCGEYSIPEEFKNNKNCDINRIKKDAQIKLSLKKILQITKNNADVLLIGEVGRGLDILISNMVKKWDKIYCWDHVDYGDYLKIFDNVEFIHRPSSLFKPIKESNIFVINHSIYKVETFFSESSIHGISEGELIW